MTNSCTSPGSSGQRPLAWFADMVDHCLEYAQAARDQGRPVIGILCEFTPRELLMAAGAVPVCLCGGSAEMIAPAEEQLPANLCPLIKSTYGYHLTKENSFLEMADLVVAETTCDGKKKMYELMAKSRPMYVLQLPQRCDEGQALSQWAAQLHDLKTFLEDRYRVSITVARLREAIATMNRYRRLRRELADLLVADAPPLSGGELLAAQSLIWAMPDDMAVYERAIGELASLPRPDLAGRTRVLLTGVPVVHGAGKVVDIIESVGGLVVCMENCTGLKPVLEDVDESNPDPVEALAAKYLNIPCSVMTPNDGRFDSLRRLVARYRPQCIIDLSWQACLTYDVESLRVKELAQELHLPFLRISTDYSPSDAARIGLRVEALLETARGQAGRP